LVFVIGANAASPKTTSGTIPHAANSNHRLLGSPKGVKDMYGNNPMVKGGWKQTWYSKQPRTDV
jgi:hypothetical protein